MGPPNEDGPDGSSIKPVSSLRARFENMSKTSTDALTPHPSPLPLVPSRPISPAPKPDKFREPPTPVTANKPSFAPLTKPKPWETSANHASSSQPSIPSSSVPDSTTLSAHAAPSSATTSTTSTGTFLRPSNKLGPPPPLSPRPIPPPSLLVQPPQSPPKGRVNNVAPGVDQSSYFLNPDAVVKAPISPSSSPRLSKIPSRPHTPTLDIRRSPRLSPSQPPSPPPPRRSAELKRERDHREQREQQEQRDKEHRAVPPPINRAEKPKIPSQHFSHAVPSSPGYFKGDAGSSPPNSKEAAERRSPFGTPPSSSESLDDEELPPSLPARPRPQLQQVDRTTSLPPPRPKAAPSGFEPPPIHHSIASRRMEREQEAAGNGPLARGLLSPQITGGDEARPRLPTRPQTLTEPVQIPRNHIAASSRPPPQPPRPGTNANGGAIAGNGNGVGMPTKRVASNPTTSNQQQFPPPPTRNQHGRSMTLDRAPARFPNDFRTSTTALATIPAGTAGSGTSTPTDSSSSIRGHSAGIGSSISSSDTLVQPSAAKTADNPAATFPDATNINRRPPYVKQGLPEINTRYDTRLFDVCGQRIVTTGHLTRVWSLLDGELLMSFAHGENVKATSVAFKPGAHVDDEGNRLWIGNNIGELMEADIATQSIVASKPGAHSRHEIIKIHRHFNELWTLCDGGALYVWGPVEDGNVPSLTGNQHQSFRLPKGHTFSMVVGDELWHATGKEVRVFLPTLDGKAQFQVLMRALYQEGAGEVSAGTVSLSEPDKVFLGHTDGKVSIYSRTDYSCLGLISLGSYKINTLASAASYLWAGYNTGHLSVYDTGSTPWVVKKDWIAHEQPVVKLLADRSSSFRFGQLQVVSLGADNMLRVWDGLLQDDWLEEEMQKRDTTYCDFDTIRAHVMTWNAGASTPSSLRYSEDDARFMQNLLQSSGSPDILVFGFQELVDLEDKTATAKRILKVKKKEGSDQERMSHQYRDWRDFLVRSLDDFMGGELYHLLQTAHMVGLFTCIFVKADLRDRIRNVANAEVKRGMGGLHGNKGAIMVRFHVDDTSLCFVNCHLAAGQSQAAHRHNDIAAILESTNLPIERDANARIDSYTGGGDGTMILDHELCVINGDLNYRIDTMSRDTVVGAVKAGNLAKLLDRDQLLVARRRNAAFRLRAFEELPIQFAPTYKYDVGTDNYDSSEKRRSPAWCDRLLFRGGHGGRVQQLDYRRHEVRVSDHRPVTGRFQFMVKRIDPKRRAVAWMECQQHLEDYKDQVTHDEK